MGDPYKNFKRFRAATQWRRAFSQEARVIRALDNQRATTPCMNRPFFIIIIQNQLSRADDDGFWKCEPEGF